MCLVHSDAAGKPPSGRPEQPTASKAGASQAGAAHRLTNAQGVPPVTRTVSVGGTIRFKSDVQTVAPPITKLFSQSTGSSRSVQDVYDTSASWELGRGGCGAVYTVRHRQTSEEFAMKSVSISGLDEAAVNELRNEIEIQSRLDHPNIVKLIEWFEDAEREAIYIILELCLGGSLVHRMRRHRRGPPARLVPGFCSWGCFLLLLLELGPSQLEPPPPIPTGTGTTSGRLPA